MCFKFSDLAGTSSLIGLTTEFALFLMLCYKKLEKTEKILFLFPYSNVGD